MLQTTVKNDEIMKNVSVILPMDIFEMYEMDSDDFEFCEDFNYQSLGEYYFEEYTEWSFTGRWKVIKYSDDYSIQFEVIHKVDTSSYGLFDNLIRIFKPEYKVSYKYITEWFDDSAFYIIEEEIPQVFVNDCC